MASLALQYAVAGHAASASVDAAVVTRLCVSVSLASIALPAPPCVAAGVRLATAAGLTSSTRLTAGVAPAVAAALDGAAGASPPEAAAALFSRVLFLTPPPAEAEDDDEDEDDSGSEPNENREGGDSFASSRRSAREPDARAAILDVACGALSALPEDDGVAGSLDEFAILTCALLSWPSIGAAPDAARSRAAVQMVTGLGVAAFGPVAARFAALERGEYSSDSALESKSDPLEKRHRGKRASPVTRTHNRHNRRAFFRDACRAMGEAGCTSAQAWAQALRALAAAAAAAKSDADARLAAADLLVAWLDARVHAEGKGAWETKALAAAASELVDMDDAALAPACSALASRDVTAEPAAVVDAVLLGELTPHADDESDDVKVRLAPWDPAAERVEGGGDKKVGGEARAGGTAARAPRVRGVSVAGEDRLRRWARTWLADAAADAENLLAGTARGAAASTPKGSRHMRAEDARARARRVSEASDSASDSGDEAAEPTKSVDASGAFVLVGGVASNSAAATAPSTAARAPLALGEGWGDRTVDPLFAVLKSPATGGKRSASATLTPALANPVGSRSPSRFASSSFPPGTGARASRASGSGSTPGSLGGTSPATSRRERRRARALGVPYAQTLETVETVETVANAAPTGASPSPRDPPERSGGAKNARDRDGEGEKDVASAFRLRRRGDDEGGDSPLRLGGLPPAPASESSVDDLVRGLGEMQAFELDLTSEEAAVSPADPRRMRDADYKEASRRAKEISAARRAERQLASPTRGRPATPRAGPSA